MGSKGSLGLHPPSNPRTKFAKTRTRGMSARPKRPQQPNVASRLVEALEDRPYPSGLDASSDRPNSMLALGARVARHRNAPRLLVKPRRGAAAHQARYVRISAMRSAGARESSRDGRRSRLEDVGPAAVGQATFDNRPCVG